MFGRCKDKLSMLTILLYLYKLMVLNTQSHPTPRLLPHLKLLHVEGVVITGLSVCGSCKVKHFEISKRSFFASQDRC